MVELIGGGGAGGGVSGGSSSGSAAAGGSAGGYTRKTFTGVSSANWYYYSVGASGIPLTGYSTGGSGGNTLFSGPSFPILASGGFGGSGMPPGTAVTVTNSRAGSAGYSGDVNSPGNAGFPGIRLSATVGIGGGGGDSFLGAGTLPIGTAKTGEVGSFGAGGGGALHQGGPAANTLGGPGGVGVIVITEWMT